MASKGKRKRQDSDISFQLYEGLKAALKDLARIRKMIPCEISRIPMKCTESESDAIIVARKDDLLRYVQTICEDHLHWGGKLMVQGWTADMAENGFDQGNGRKYKPPNNKRFDIDNW